MRSSLLVLIFAAMTMLAPAPAYADATSDIGAMSQAFTAVHSFHADITTTRGVMSMDVVKPDKFHMTMNGMMQVISIGTDMWANMNGSWQHMSMPAGMMQRPMDMARYAGGVGAGPKRLRGCRRSRSGDARRCADASVSHGGKDRRHRRHVGVEQSPASGASNGQKRNRDDQVLRVEQRPRHHAGLTRRYPKLTSSGTPCAAWASCALGGPRRTRATAPQPRRQ